MSHAVVPDLSFLHEKMYAAAVQTGQWIRAQQKLITREHIEVKALNSLVTFVDKEAEKQLMAILGPLVEGSQFCAEETAFDTSLDHDSYYWIIDPLDGTTNYLHNIPFCAVSLAFAHGQDVLIGVVYDIFHDDVFHAIKGQGFFLNNNRILHDGTHAVLGKSLIATGIPYHDFQWKEEYLKILSSLMEKTRGIRRLGSAALDLAYVAAGRFDMFFELGLSPWDIAAGVLCAREAGCEVTTFGGSKKVLTDKTILAAASSVHPHFYSMIQSVRKDFL
jgi:myo-inositol-1(or 4)-monophosphatase